MNACNQIGQGSSISFVHNILLSTPSPNHLLEWPSSPPSDPFHNPFRSCPAAPHPYSPPCAGPCPNSCNSPSSTYQEHRTQHSNHHTQKVPRTDFATELISSQLPSFIVQRANIRIVDRREERPGSRIGNAGRGLLLSAPVMRKRMRASTIAHQLQWYREWRQEKQSWRRQQWGRR